MPKQQAIIQECEKCKTTFARYEETPLCDACYGVEKAVKSFKENDELEYDGFSINVDFDELLEDEKNKSKTEFVSNETNKPKTHKPKE